MSIWIIILPLVTLGFAYLMKRVATEMLEQEHHFFWAVAIFFVLFIGAAFTVHAYVPAPTGHADLSSLTQLWP